MFARKPEELSLLFYSGWYVVNKLFTLPSCASLDITSTLMLNIKFSGFLLFVWHKTEGGVWTLLVVVSHDKRPVLKNAAIQKYLCRKIKTKVITMATHSKGLCHRKPVRNRRKIKQSTQSAGTKSKWVSFGIWLVQNKERFFFYQLQTEVRQNQRYLWLLSTHDWKLLYACPYFELKDDVRCMYISLQVNNTSNTLANWCHSETKNFKTDSSFCKILTSGKQYEQYSRQRIFWLSTAAITVSSGKKIQF